MPDSYPFASPCGDKKRKLYVWNGDYTDLVEVGEIDIQEELDEAGLGRSSGEMVRRILVGDTSALKPGDGMFVDVSAVPESGVEAASAALAPRNKLEKIAAEKGLTMAELRAALAALDSEDSAKPEAEPKADEKEGK